jgi:putative flippase GtrA
MLKEIMLFQLIWIRDYNAKITNNKSQMTKDKIYIFSRKLLKQEMLRQFIKFCIIGAINTLLDFGIYIFLSRVLGFYFLYANITSVTLAMASSFILNKYWTFKNFDKGLKQQSIKFILVNLVYFFLNNSIVYISVHFFQAHDLLAKMIAVAIGLFWNFGANKYWTFKKPKVEENPALS